MFVLVVAAAVTVFATSNEVHPDQTDDIRRILDTATALSGVAVFALCRATWRQIGDRAALWAGAAGLAVALAAATRPELVEALLGGHAPDGAVLRAASTAAMVMTPLLFAAGLVPRVQRIKVTAASLGVMAVAAVAVVAALVHASPAVGRALTLPQLTDGGRGGTVGGGTLVAAAWLGLATGYAVRGLRRRWLYTWAGPLLFALTLAGVAAGAAGADNGWAVGAAILEAVGMAAAVVSCHAELTRTYEDQSLQLFDSEVDAETAEVRERVRAANLRARRHDLINAITAIDGAAMILEREFERLSAADRENLARLVGSGTARLRRLVSQEGGDESRVSLAQAAKDVAADPAWTNGVELEVTADLVAAGSAGETVEAVRQLVDYARRRAPGSPVTLRGERDGEWVVLRVEDRGPTLPRDLRRLAGDTDSRWSPDHEEAMGLRLAARLMRGQGGDLWVEPRPGGGTSYGICLPAVAAGNGEAGGDDA